jgi:hypothetical protein
MSNIVGFENSMIGVDCNNTINAYYQRDISMNLNNTNTIVQSLKKLGYYNLNLNLEEEIYLKAQVINWIKNNSYSQFVNLSLQDIISQIKNTEDYSRFINRLNSRIERASNLSNLVNTTDTFDFYSALTLDELNYLGY